MGRMRVSASTLLLALIFLAIAPSRGHGQPLPKVDEQFELARNAFEYQDHDKVIELLDPLLNPVERLPTPAMATQAREWLGAARWWKQDKVGFKQEFTHLLKADPLFALDSFYYPPDMVADYQKLREQLIQLQIIEAKKPGPKEPDIPGQTVIVRTIERRHPLITLIPFGTGQFVNGKTGKGIVFLSTQVIFLSANIGSWAYLYTAQPSGSSRSAALGTMYGSFALFTGMAVWGIFDAYADWSPETVLEEKRLEMPDESASMWQVAPWPVAGGVGLSFGTPF
jgi:hypothetical protein